MAINEEILKNWRIDRPHLCELVSQMRARVTAPDLLELLQNLEAPEIEVTDEDFARLILNSESSGFWAPYKVSKSIFRYLKLLTEEISPASLLDPHVDADSVLLRYAVERPGIRATAFVAPTWYRLLKDAKSDGVYGGARIAFRETSYHMPRFIAKTQRVRAQDMVVSSLPVALRPTQAVIDGIEIVDEPGRIMLLAASLRLKPTGVGVFLVSPNFLSDEPSSVFQRLADFGLFLDGIIDIPAGSFPNTSIGGAIAIIRKAKQELLFVGQIQDSDRQNRVLIRNWKERQRGRTIELGALVELRSFSTFGRYVKEQELDRKASRLNLNRLPIATLSREINLVADSGSGAFPSRANGVYLPRFNLSEVLTDLDGPAVSAREFIQLVVDTKVARPDYVARFLNSPLGKECRELMLGGTPAGEITQRTLDRCAVYLPSVEAQYEVLQEDNAIRQLQSELAALSDRLWKQPAMRREIAKQVKKIGATSSIVSWLDSLPFPIAGIVWAYHAEAEPKEKVAFLFYFFEALAEFLAVVIWSGFVANSEFTVP